MVGSEQERGDDRFKQGQRSKTSNFLVQHGDGGERDWEYSNLESVLVGRPLLPLPA